MIPTGTNTFANIYTQSFCNTASWEYITLIPQVFTPPQTHSPSLTCRAGAFTVTAAHVTHSPSLSVRRFKPVTLHTCPCCHWFIFLLVLSLILQVESAFKCVFRSTLLATTCWCNCLFVVCTTWLKESRKMINQQPWRWFCTFTYVMCDAQKDVLSFHPIDILPKDNRGFYQRTE